jgi:hypothetical protein
LGGARGKLQASHDDDDDEPTRLGGPRRGRPRKK